jgi:hypothetical protein
MRLDCDENIASARDLFAWYAGEGIPISLAVKTDQPLQSEDFYMLEDVVAHGGTILSHSHTHPANWGASHAEALAEAQNARVRLAEICPGQPTDLAVSPFHTNPPYAVQALAQAGFAGFVSGIIHNDPEYLLGRAGIVPFVDGKLVSISQQSMLHGDSYRRQGCRVDVHIAAFEAQYTARGIFGYLDHPFSARYQYDWESEDQRLRAHRMLINAIRCYDDVWFWSQRQCFDYLQTLASIRLSVDRRGRVQVAGAPFGSFRPVIRYQGEETAV